MGRLTDARARSLTHSGRTRADERHGDGPGGNGLLLSVKASGAKSWVQSLTVRGKRRNAGLGPYPLVSLRDARQIAAENRRIAREGGDPFAERARRRTVPTFEECAREYVEEVRAANWSSGGKSRASWEGTLAAYVYPRVGALPVNAITSADVLAAVAPIWSTKRETAGRVRQRISLVMRYAILMGYRADDPATPEIVSVLPTERAPVQHMRTLHHADVTNAIVRVRVSDAALLTKRMFEFMVLTAARPGEARHARWAEIDLDARVWKRPGERMKMRLEHWVPLSSRALQVLGEVEEISAGHEFVFPSPRGKPLSDSTLSKLLRKLGVGAVPHGFRSSFRTWGAEVMGAPKEILEVAIAHTQDDPYDHSVYFDRRIPLMQAWAEYVWPALGRPTLQHSKRLAPRRLLCDSAQHIAMRADSLDARTQETSPHPCGPLGHPTVSD